VVPVRTARRRAAVFGAAIGGSEGLGSRPRKLEVEDGQGSAAQVSGVLIVMWAVWV
jgi:hypothetical protein